MYSNIGWVERKLRVADRSVNAAARVAWRAVLDGQGGHPYTAVMLAERLSARDDAPVDDHIVVLRNAAWSDYQRHLELRGERPVPRFAYLEGVLQLMTPSRQHESLKSVIGHLVEVWCLERGIEFRAFGSWTIEDKAVERGVEPDECYVFGNEPDTQRPDLAIEVVWTRGGIDKREI